MSPFIKLHHIVHLRHMLRKWHRLAMKATSFSTRAPPLSTAVPPPGHLAVYVGLQQERQRFVIKTSLLMHPLFKALLKKSEEELGFHYEGGLAIPCEVAVFNQLLPLMQLSPTSWNPTQEVSDIVQCDHDRMWLLRQHNKDEDGNYGHHHHQQLVRDIVQLLLSDIDVDAGCSATHLHQVPQCPLSYGPLPVFG